MSRLDLNHNPNLIDDLAYLSNHPHLKVFLEHHPHTRKELRGKGLHQGSFVLRSRSKAFTRRSGLHNRRAARDRVLSCNALAIVIEHSYNCTVTFAI
jgi:hypothetical protein